jgi:hypothetical protein
MGFHLQLKQHSCIVSVFTNWWLVLMPCWELLCLRDQTSEDRPMFQIQRIVRCSCLGSKASMCLCRRPTTPEARLCLRFNGFPRRDTTWLDELEVILISCCWLRHICSTRGHPRPVSVHFLYQVLTDSLL